MELVVGLAAPILGGLVSLAIWQAKSNSKRVEDGLGNLHDCVHEVSRKVDDISLDVAKNYCTRQELRDHIDKEEDWHNQHHEEVKELRQDMKDKAAKMANDLAELKDTQWKMRLDQLENRDR